jgi:hypothetical protein
MLRVADALFAEAGAMFRRFAIVVPPARVPLANIFAALADPHGVTANVFGDAESAREWLAERGRPGREGPGDGGGLSKPLAPTPE